MQVSALNADLAYVPKRVCTSRVPYKYKAGGFRLGTWVSEQRSQYAKGKLDSSKSTRLEKLPGWTWNPPTGVWIDR